MVNEERSFNSQPRRNRGRGNSSFRGRGNKRGMQSDFDHQSKRQNRMQSPRQQCSYCNKIGHSEDTCWQKDDSSRPTCSLCNKIGHSEDRCWSSDKGNERSQGGFWSAKGGRGNFQNRGRGRKPGFGNKSKFVCRNCGHDESKCKGESKSSFADADENDMEESMNKKPKFLLRRKKGETEEAEDDGSNLKNKKIEDFDQGDGIEGENIASEEDQSNDEEAVGINEPEDEDDDDDDEIEDEDDDDDDDDFAEDEDEDDE